MIVPCITCRMNYDDARRWTICPHRPLDQEFADRDSVEECHAAALSLAPFNDRVARILAKEREDDKRIGPLAGPA